MAFTTRQYITDLLLVNYVAKCEEINPGIVERTIADVSGEVESRLQRRYPQPWPYVPEIIRYIASVIAAYRIVENITSLVATEASSENEWIPLQKQWKHAEELLDDLVKGKTSLEFEAVDEREEPSIAVVSPKKQFDWRGW